MIVGWRSKTRPTSRSPSSTMPRDGSSVEIARTPNGSGLLRRARLRRRREDDDRGRVLAGVERELRRVHLPPVGVEADDVQRERLDELAGVAQRERRLRLAAGLGAQRRRVQRQDGQVGGLGRLTRVAAGMPAATPRWVTDVLPRPAWRSERRSPPRTADHLFTRFERRNAAPTAATCPTLPERAGSRTRPVAPRPGPRRTRARDAAGVIHDVDQALRALIRRDAVAEARRRGRLRRAHQGLGRPAQRADDRRLPLRHPRGHAAPRARAGQRVRRHRPRRRPPPAAAALQAVVPGHRLDPAARGRAPAAVVAAGVLPAARRDPGGPARRRR